MGSPHKKPLDLPDAARRLHCFVLSGLFLFIASALIICSLKSAPARAEGGQPPATGPAVRTLTAGTTINDKLGPGSLHTYALALSGREHVRATVGKGDLNLTATLRAPGGGSRPAFVGRRYGPLEVSFTADAPGEHLLEVRSLEGEGAGERPYSVSLGEARPATEADRQYDSAAGAFAEAEGLLARYEENALRQAVEKYLSAAALWKAVAPRREAEALRAAGDVYFLLSDYRQALTYYRQSHGASRRGGDGEGVLESLNSIGYAHIYLGANETALGYVTKVRQARQHRPPTADEGGGRLLARSLNSIGEIQYSRGELEKSLQYFSHALGLWEAAGDRRGQALAHVNIGYSHTDSGNLTEARRHYARALELWRQSGDPCGVALARTALGGIHSFLGDKRQALDAHSQALGLFRAIGNRQGAAAAINGVAQAYEDLGDYGAALNNYRQALELYRRIGSADFTALNEYYVGRVSYSLREVARARESYERALALSREVGDRQIEAHVLRGQGIIYSSENNHPEALRRFRRALAIYERVGDRRGGAYTLNEIGYVYYKAGRVRDALAHFRQALARSRDCEERRGEILILYNIARAERERGNVEEALARIRESVAVIESSRAGVDGQELRTSYFAAAHKHYELYIDLLMRMHERQPDAGHSAAAFLVSEHARARSLLDMVVGKGAGGSPHHELLAREHELQQLLEAKRTYRARLLGGGRPGAQVLSATKEIDDLTREYEAVRSRIREEIPRYAAMTQPDLLGLPDIQAELPDANTLLLELSLGDERSYLWAVSRDRLTAHELPGREVLEAMAQSACRALAARSGAAQPDGRNAPAHAGDFEAVAALSRTLFGPVASQLGSKRLLLVTEGALQYVPFDALPLPEQTPAGGDDAAAPPPANGRQVLLDRHEIVGLPSASILAAIRREHARPRPNAKTVIVLADPVFDKDDPRVLAGGDQLAAPAAAAAMPASAHGYLRDVLAGSGGEGGQTTIPRLPGSLREAKAIMAVVSPDEGAMAVGFEANRARVTGDGLHRFRIVHFATHGVLDSERPEQSGLVLSLVDAEGTPQEGYLRLSDIYELDLSADLVVLSACRTGLGQSVRGEGSIGLTRGFIYAGSKSVVASLWKVDDAATAEIMKHFYGALIRDGLSPAKALRAAKQAVRAQERWRAPYFWAGFFIQGEYAGSFAAPSGAPKLPLAAAALGAALALSAGLYAWRRRRTLSQAAARHVRATRDGGGPPPPNGHLF